MHWTDVMSLSGTAAGVAEIALLVFVFGRDWNAFSAGAVALIVCVAIVVILRIADQGDAHGKNPKSARTAELT
jgi:hypothetical protein